MTLSDSARFYFAESSPACARSLYPAPGVSKTGAKLAFDAELLFSESDDAHVAQEVSVSEEIVIMSKQWGPRTSCAPRAFAVDFPLKLASPLDRSIDEGSLTITSTTT